AAMEQLLLDDLEIDTTTLGQRLLEKGFDRNQVDTALREDFLTVQEQAMLTRIHRLLADGPLSRDAVIEQITPRAWSNGEISDARLLASRCYDRVLAIRQLDRFMTAIPPSAPPLLQSRLQAMLVPVPLLISQAAYSGYVDFVQSEDAVVRTIPLVASFQGRLYPHMVLATACADLGVNISDIRVTPDRLTLPLAGGDAIEIPIRTIRQTKFGEVGAFMDLPWFGDDKWENMYDWPKFQRPLQQESIKNIWRVQQLQDSIRANRQKAHNALMFLQVGVLGAVEQEIRPRLEAMTDAELDEAIRQILAMEDLRQPFEELKKMPAAELREDEQQFVASYEALGAILRNNQFLQQRIVETRQDLARKLGGKLVFVGATSLGLYDYYSTSLHPQCPGVVIQSVALNAILTREFWRQAPGWVDPLLTGLIGACVTLFVAFLPSYRALVATIVMVFAYFVLNGIVLFDLLNWIVPAAGAITAAGVVWGILTLYRYIFESAERARITKRFSGYVDPALVNYLVENPEARLDGEVKEMTVVFTDLAGFTTISEKLKERTVPLLNEYMSRMLPIIRANRGFWNKFLGDGIMFFYNAIPPNPNHARDAVYTVMEMQKAMEPFNEYLRERQLPRCAMRAGISTGLMVVGDAGSKHEIHEAADYTVLGDEVNLSARLESANKALGSRVLMTQRTVDLMGDEFLYRPMGRLQVVGKTEGVMTYEPLCLKTEATPQQVRLAELSAKVVHAFVERRFDDCICAAEQMQQEFGSSKFTALYLAQAREFQIAPPPADWDGTIVLETK
ncbi:MAG: CHASE2 domain-containing protein, partial [Phycisphaerae bacterium]|nr:CHASE2 domain-containing protein [Phycisphaerae bacterium]MDW8262040.1 adenylate/guanylate cyclase domain-containing protein [Phycisphaerales bacterium]